MSGEDEEREKREGSHSLHRLVMKALVEKRDAERVPQLAGALYLQLLLMMRLHCRDETKWGKCKVHGATDRSHFSTHLKTTVNTNVETVSACCNHSKLCLKVIYIELSGLDKSNQYPPNVTPEKEKSFFKRSECIHTTAFSNLAPGVHLMPSFGTHQS